MRKTKKRNILFFLIGLILIFNRGSGKEEILFQIGPNIRASAEIEKYGRNECWIVSSLDDPKFLLGISQSFSDHRLRGKCICPVIISHDGGQTWKEVTLPEGNEGFDPLVLAGPDGIMYVMLSGIRRWSDVNTRIWSTRDKGETWQGPTEIYGYSIDHPRIVVDTSGGTYHGRVYFAWNQWGDTVEKDKYNIYLHYSDDEGKSFVGPIWLQKVEGGKLVIVDLVVLSDGTLIIPYYKFYYPLDDKKNEKKPLWILTSVDGARNFSDPQKVIDIGSSEWLDLKKDFPAAFALPIVTADTSKGSPYRDRVYMVWDDCTRTGDSNIWLIWSADKGKSWSEPARVNDNLPCFKKGPKDFRVTPVAAVNREGILGVAWYDRRDDPTRRCWNYYMAFSLDGGQTFTKNIKISSSPSCPEKNIAPSIRVTNMDLKPKEGEKPSVPSVEVSFDRARSVWPGHYTGLNADLEGRFHSLWADRRNGIQQLYTAVVEVLQKHSELPKLSEEMDINDKVRLIAGLANFDEDKSISTFKLQIQNVSDEPIFAPLKLRVKNIKEGLNNIVTVEILNSDNRKKGIGSIWDFSFLMGSKKWLDPKEITEVKEIKIKTFIEAGLDGKIEFEVVGKTRKKLN